MSEKLHMDPPSEGGKAFQKWRKNMRNCLILALAIVLMICFAPLPASAESTAGRIEVHFVYLEPGSEDPTYHTAIWLEDMDGKIAQTLFVSINLSEADYKTGACPDWAKQAGWEKAPKSLVNAVTGPTPDVAEGMMPFDLGRFDVAPGKYKFRMEVNIDAEHNVLFQGDLVVGDSEQELTTETLYLPSKPDIGTDVVRDVKVNYIPAGH
jgi:hypothetical protein